VRQRGEWTAARLGELKARRAQVTAVRGLGLMWGIELAEPVQRVIERAFEHRLLVIAAGPNVIRLLPPLVISESELEHGLSILEQCL
jgi:acetylornithine aminotransferase